MLYLSIIFIINCFFFDESLVHKRYLNALNGRSNNISYFFQKEFKISIYTALISSAITIFIKIIIKWIFKIDKKIIVKIRDKYFKDRYRKTIIYIILLFVINIFIAYGCICYGAIFSNSYSFFILSFFSSYIISYIFWMVLCFIFFSIIMFYKIWKETDNLIIQEKKKK